MGRYAGFKPCKYDAVDDGSAQIAVIPLRHGGRVKSTLSGYSEGPLTNVRRYLAEVGPRSSLAAPTAPQGLGRALAKVTTIVPGKMAGVAEAAFKRNCGH
jgi:hypothetical protein